MQSLIESINFCFTYIQNIPQILIICINFPFQFMESFMDQLKRQQKFYSLMLKQSMNLSKQYVALSDAQKELAETLNSFSIQDMQYQRNTVQSFAQLLLQQAGAIAITLPNVEVTLQCFSCDNEIETMKKICKAQLAAVPPYNRETNAAFVLNASQYQQNRMVALQRSMKALSNIFMVQASQLFQTATNLRRQADNMDLQAPIIDVARRCSHLDLNKDINQLLKLPADLAKTKDISNPALKSLKLVKRGEAFPVQQQTGTSYQSQLQTGFENFEQIPSTADVLKQSFKFDQQQQQQQETQKSLSQSMQNTQSFASQKQNTIKNQFLREEASPPRIQQQYLVESHKERLVVPEFQQQTQKTLSSLQQQNIQFQQNYNLQNSQNLQSQQTQQTQQNQNFQESEQNVLLNQSQKPVQRKQEVKQYSFGESLFEESSGEKINKLQSQNANQVDDGSDDQMIMKAKILHENTKSSQEGQKLLSDNLRLELDEINKMMQELQITQESAPKAELFSNQNKENQVSNSQQLDFVKFDQSSSDKLSQKPKPLAPLKQQKEKQMNNFQNLLVGQMTGKQEVQ